MTLKRFDVTTAFATFAAAGCRPPKAHETDEGLEFALRVWTAALADLDRDTLLELVIAFVRSPGSKWWPTPGELLALRGSVGDDDALEQWGRLLGLLSSYGRANPPTLPSEYERALELWNAGEALPAYPPWVLSTDADVDAGMRAGLEGLGGWRAACKMSDRNEVANRAAFRDGYRSSRSRRSRGLEREAVAAIAGGTLPAMLTGGVG